MHGLPSSQASGVTAVQSPARQANPPHRPRGWQFVSSAHGTQVAGAPDPQKTPIWHRESQAAHRLQRLLRTRLTLGVRILRRNRGALGERHQGFFAVDLHGAEKNQPRTGTGRFARDAGREAHVHLVQFLAVRVPVRDGRKMDHGIGAAERTEHLMARALEDAEQIAADETTDARDVHLHGHRICGWEVEFTR